MRPSVTRVVQSLFTSGLVRHPSVPVAAAPFVPLAHSRAFATSSHRFSTMPVPQPIIIYALTGSQYVFKVLAAMQDRGIDHYVWPVPTDIKKRRKLLPSGGKLLPEMLVGTGDDKEIVQDSEKILHWLDDHCSANLFPTDQVATVSERASDGVLAGYVWYYNWVEETGYRRSLRTTVGTKVVPWFVPYFAVDLVLKSTRAYHRGLVLKKLPNANLEDEPSMRKGLAEELKYFQSLLESEEQTYLIPSTDRPTAADFSLYALLERLVGDQQNGKASSDAPIEAAILDMKTNDPFDLARLWKWHDHMRQTYKVQFNDKTVPDEIKSKL